MHDIVDFIPDVGDRSRLGNHALSGKTVFSNATGAAADPTTVTLLVYLPNGTLGATYTWHVVGVSPDTLTREGLGRFYAEYTWTVGGLHWCKLAGTGAVTAVDWWGVFVAAPPVGA